jgi:hypothetical protein
MADTEEYIRRIMQAKAYIDNGLCRVGPSLKPTQKIEAVLAGGASRCLALGDSVVQLCRQDNPNEALPIVRQLAETVASMGWATAGESPESRALEILEARTSVTWESLWSEESFKERAIAAGMTPEDISDISDKARDFLAANAKTAPWSHIFEENQSAGADSEFILKFTARMMGFCLKTLDGKWPESFPGAEAMWAKP